MAMTLQRKVELAAVSAMVQPLLERLHLVEKPKERRVLRDIALVGSGFVAGAVVAVAACRRGCCGGVAGNAGDAQAGSPASSSGADPGLEGPATAADGT